jgi:hypothetical protein
MKSEIIIDRKKKVLFLQIPKTGSTSVKNSFKKYHEDAIEEMYCYSHEGIDYFHKHLPDFHEYQAYATIRNPFDQVMSWYTQVLAMARNKKTAEENVYNEEIIKDFVQKHIVSRDMHVRQSGRITINGAIPENVHLFRFENGFYHIMRYMREKHDYRLTYQYNKRCPFKYKKEKLLENDLLRESIKVHLAKEFEILGYPNEYE